MTFEEQKQIVKNLVHFNDEEIEKYCKNIDNKYLGACLPTREGFSLFVDENGDVLFANSSISYETAFLEFKKGRRSNKENFKNFKRNW